MADAMVSSANFRSLRYRLRERLTVERRRGRGYVYSVYRTRDSARNPDLLYYFHGAGQSDRSWPHWSFAHDFYEACRRQDLPPPTVISISFGHLWLLTEDGPYDGEGLLRRFLEEALPDVERAVGKPRYRFGWGMSMGGFNLMELLYRRPDMWRAVALSSPAIPTLGPLSAEAELSEYLRRTKAGSLRVRWMFDFVRPHFPTAEHWLRHDPLALATAATDLPPVLIECGDQDEWGFFEGAQRLHAALLAAGATVVLRLRAGGFHGEIDAASVVAFFQSHAIELGWTRRVVLRFARARHRLAVRLRRAMDFLRRAVPLTIRAGQFDTPSMPSPPAEDYNDGQSQSRRNECPRPCNKTPSTF